jgi:hypothetical protein
MAKMEKKTPTTLLRAYSKLKITEKNAVTHEYCTFVGLLNQKVNYIHVFSLSSS